MEKVTKKLRISKKTKIIIACILAVVLVLGGIFAYYAGKACTNKIYEGVYVGDVHLGGKTGDEALDLLSQSFSHEELNFRLRCEGREFDVYGSQIDLKPDYDLTIKNAAELGKNGSVFKKISNMNKLKSSPKNIPLVFVCDTNMLGYVISENLSGLVEDVTEYSVEIGEDCLIISNGKDGKSVNPAVVMEKLSDAYTNGTLGEAIDVEIETIKSGKIDFEEFYREYNREAVDAVLNNDGENFTIEAEVVGVKLDRDETKRILEENASNTQSYMLPAEITYPEVTAAQLEAEFTDCVIATYRTDYSSSSANRKENIRLASEAINGKILNPGEVFSYNQTVGPRTAEAGYKVAHVYSGGKTVDGIGGGICQVSSTLYNAVVFADLEIVYRTNHSLPVSYVPLGRDATVSYGTIDFKFKNNKATPIKIEIIADGTYLTVNIYGRKKYIKDISIETAVVGSIPFTTTEIKDDTLFEDETKIEEAGSNGTVVEAYKVVKEDGAVVSRELLCKSSYVPTAEVVRVGTKKREADDTLVETPPEDETGDSSISTDTSAQPVNPPQADLPQSATPDAGVNPDTTPETQPTEVQAGSDALY